MSEQTNGALLREVLRLHLQAQRASVACCGGTTLTQCFILTELGRAGPVTLAELGRRLGLDKSWTSRAVDSMAKQGLLKKMPGKEDRRTILISLSPAGQRRYAELNQALDSQAERVLSRVPKGNQPGVSKALQLLREALQAEVASTSRKSKGGSCVDKPKLPARRAS
jgi:DNA-binding MarR family transcriptional regulator